MFKPIINFIISVHERTGNFGLVFFLIIIVINLYSFWWWLPRSLRASEMAFSKINVSQYNLRVYWGIANGIFGVILAGIILAPEPNLWLKIFSGIVFIVVVMTLVYSIWLLVNKKPS